MYLGLCFTSRYILPIYSPIIPRHISCIPPRKQRVDIKLAQPERVLPKKNPITTQIIKIKLNKDTTNPNSVINLSGLVLKLVIPSTAKANIFESG